MTNRSYTRVIRELVAVEWRDVVQTTIEIEPHRYINEAAARRLRLITEPRRERAEAATR
jgi:hypothetical protein